MSCSAILSKATTFYRDLQLDNVQREKDFGIVDPKWDITLKSLPSNLRILWGKGRNIVRANGYGRQQRNIPFHTTDTHVNSQRLWQHVQSLLWFKPEGTQ